MVKPKFTNIKEFLKNFKTNTADPVTVAYNTIHEKAWDAYKNGTDLACSHDVFAKVGGCLRNIQRILYELETAGRIKTVYKIRCRKYYAPNTKEFFDNE